MEILYRHFPLEYAISKVQENQVGLKLNETHRLMVKLAHRTYLILIANK
jgi:hypothetical protein